MLNQMTMNKLHEMRLTTMADAYRSQMQNPAFTELSFEDRFGLLVDSEWDRRRNRYLNRLLRNAGLYLSNACIEDIEYHADRKLDKGQITQLSTCNYVIILGATGAGKTYLGCSLGVAACRNLYTAKYIRLPDLLNELAIARGEGCYAEVIKQYRKVSLLILDEWLLVPLGSSEARDLLEIVEARNNLASTIFCSQFTPAGWHAKIGEDTLADAILDRIIYNSYKIIIEGKDSMRKRKGIQE
jgi:DNA replication protein DnaC